MKPLVIDLYAGLGGWTEGLLAEGWDAIGFDVERHDYGAGGYPAQLVLQDVRTLDGRQFRAANLIVASPPCQEFSYRSMPWKLGKARGPKALGVAEPEWWDKAEAEMCAVELEEWRAWKEANPLPPPDLSLFEACFRLQTEASSAAGRRIPLVVENVVGAQKWCGSALARYGSFYFWGDISTVGDRILCGPPRFGAETILTPSNRGSKVGISWSGYGKEGYTRPSFDGTAAAKMGQKLGDKNSFLTSGKPSPHFTDHSEPGVKNGGDWFGSGAACSKQRKASSKSPRRKAGSAEIAKIPRPLSRYIARSFKPGG